MQVNKGLIVTQKKHNKGKRSRQGTVELRAVPKKSTHQKGPTLPTKNIPMLTKPTWVAPAPYLGCLTGISYVMGCMPMGSLPVPKPLYV